VGEKQGRTADLPGAHGFTLFPNDLSKAATAKMDAFLNRVLG
jgi:hypothetical protein